MLRRSAIVVKDVESYGVDFFMLNPFRTLFLNNLVG